MDLGPPELVIILLIVLVLFGGRKLPDLARSLGQARREFDKAGKEPPADDPVDGTGPGSGQAEAEAEAGAGTPGHLPGAAGGTGEGGAGRPATPAS